MVSVLLSPDLRSTDELSNMDDKLFNCTTSDEHYVLHQLFKPERPVDTHPDHEDTNSVSHPNPG